MIRQSKPDLRVEDFAYIDRIVKTGQAAQGSMVAELEKISAMQIGTRHAVAVSNGTAALHLTLLALGIGPGDEVLVPSYTCAAVLQSVHYTGAGARLIDVDSHTFNISLMTARRHISRRSKALVVTHTFGSPAPLKDLLGLGVPIIEDCSHSLGASYRGRPTGSWGIASIFSMYATKMVCAGEGGMICSDDSGLIRRVRDMNGPDQHARWGARYNYKLSDLSAGLALSQMKRLRSFVQRRRELAARYKTAFEQCPVLFQQESPGAEPNHYRFTVLTPHAAQIVKSALQAGILCDKPISRPLHRYFTKMDIQSFPGTEAVYRDALSVPIFPALREAEVRHICKFMSRILSE